MIEVQIAISDEANRKAVDVAKKMLEAQGKTLNAEWDENANAHAAKNVGLQVTVEFISASQSPDLEDKASANGDAESGKK